MQTYQSHKKVQVVKIDAIEFYRDGSATIAYTDLSFPVSTNYTQTSKDFRRKFRPEDGKQKDENDMVYYIRYEDDMGYYIRYEDGYESWSLSPQFESGYKLAAPTPSCRPTTTKGYRKLSQHQIDLVNDHKKFEEKLLRRIDDVSAKATAAGHGDSLRWIAIARTHIEQGFMALNRAVTRPERLKDENLD